MKTPLRAKEIPTATATATATAAKVAPEYAQSTLSPAGAIQSLQRTAGNRAVGLALNLGQSVDAAQTAADRAVQRVGDGKPAQLPGGSTMAAVLRSSGDAGYMETADDWWGRQKEAAYVGLIDGIRSLKQSGLSNLRGMAQQLPAELQPAAGMLIDQVELASDLLISLGLAIVGVVVGLVSGIAHAVWGLLNLLHALLSGLILFVAGLFDERFRDQFDEKASALLSSLKDLPSNLRGLWTAWTEKFDAASTERQTLMIGELTGEIEAMLLSAMAGGGAASAAPKLVIAPMQEFAVAGVRVAGGGGAAAIDLAGPGASAVLAVSMAKEADSRAKTAATEEGGGFIEQPAPEIEPKTGRSSKAKKAFDKEVEAAVDKAKVEGSLVQGGETYSNDAAMRAKGAPVAAKRPSARGPAEPPLGVDAMALESAVQQSKKALKKEGVSGLGNTLYGTKLHNKLRELAEGLLERKLSAGTEFFNDQKLATIKKLSPSEANLTAAEWLKSKGLPDPGLSETLLKQRVGTMKPDLVFREPGGAYQVLDLTGQINPEHMAKTIFYTMFLGAP